MPRLFVLLSLVLALCLPASAHAVERLAVLELQGDLPVQERSVLADSIRGAVIRVLSGQMQVMTRENMEVMLSDMGLDASCVAEGACEVETARNLGVDYVVSGSVTPMSGTLVLSLKLHATASGELMGTELVRGADAMALLDGLGEPTTSLVQPLAKPVEPARPETVEKPALSTVQGSSAADFYQGLGLIDELPTDAFGSMVCVAPGQFDRSEKLHFILTRGFCVMRHEVTQDEWAALGLKNRSKMCQGDGSCPVDMVSWFDAIEMANAASVREGLEPAYTVDGKKVTWDANANGYRLPTRLEWFVVALAKETHKFAGSAKADDVAWYAENSANRTHPVCQKPPNAYGLCDLSGNVTEWGWDRWEKTQLGTFTDPKGPDSGPYRIKSGGSWRTAAEGTRLSYYGGISPGTRLPSAGLRLVRNAP